MPNIIKKLNINTNIDITGTEKTGLKLRVVKLRNFINIILIKS